ncbi:hypothetical protein Bca4012_081847 [Brassica carinata]
MNEGCVIAPIEFAVPWPANSTGGASDSGRRSSQCDEVELDDPSRCKRSRKNDKQSSEAGVSVESDSLEEGFKWRKYGQSGLEAMRGVITAFITTYEDQHNHHVCS